MIIKNKTKKKEENWVGPQNCFWTVGTVKGIPKSSARFKQGNRSPVKISHSIHIKTMDPTDELENKQNIVAGSKWDVMLKILLKCNEIPAKAKRFDHELSTMEHLYKSPLIR